MSSHALFSVGRAASTLCSLCEMRCMMPLPADTLAPLLAFEPELASLAPFRSNGGLGRSMLRLRKGLLGLVEKSLGADPPVGVGEGAIA